MTTLRIIFSAWCAAGMIVAGGMAAPVHAQTASVEFQGPEMQGAASASGKLADELGAKMASEEEHGHASFFPRKNVLALVTKSMWEIIYHSDASTAVLLDVLAMLKNRVTTPIQKEAVDRMQVELSLN